MCLGSQLNSLFTYKFGVVERTLSEDRIALTEELAPILTTQSRPMAAPRNAIRMVTFDALYTIFRPRQPIPVQYAEEFAAAGLGTLDPEAVARSFKAGMLVYMSVVLVGSS